MSLAAKKPLGNETKQTQKITLQKGELLFKESDASRAMYLVQRGMLRVFKGKQTGDIEIGTIHTGQVLGELAFLDGNPRSASVEALTECVLIEISGPTFLATLAEMPEWIKILLKTIVGRLRAASTRIRQLESVSTTIDYNSKTNPGSKVYSFLSPHDVLKASTALLLVASRHGKVKDDGLEISLSILQKYANQILNVPISKTTSLLDIFHHNEIIEIKEGTDFGSIKVIDLDYLEEFIDYLNDENQREPSKRRDISTKGFVVMTLIAKNIAEFGRDEKTGLTTVNVAKIIKENQSESGKSLFSVQDLEELKNIGYFTEPQLKGDGEVLCFIDEGKFLKSHRMQKIIKAIDNMNEKQRK